MRHSSHRLPSIDLLRGAVMVLMVLDHARDFVHRDGLAVDPTDLATTTPALFLTRWITHFCAPTFVFLAGLSVYLRRQRADDARRLAGPLLRRGLGLVLLELVVLRPLIWFHLDLSFAAHLQVIWAIGWAMCGLALLLWLRVPTTVVFGLGTAIVAGHNLLPHVSFAFAQLGSAAGFRMLAFGRGGLELWADGPIAIAQYALVPWFGVMLLGYAAGPLFTLPVERRRRWLLGLGAGGIAAFVALRALGVYGEPSAWSGGLLSFLRVEKYPPSLLYCLMTLAPALLVLAAAERVRGDRPLRWLVQLGRVPLVFYVLQWPAVHLVSRLLQWLDGQPVGWDAPNPLTFEALPPGCGFSLGVVYLAWALCLLALLPLSFAYDRWQRARASRLAPG